MCLAVPMKIIKVNGEKATAEQGGCSRDIRTDFLENLVPGDYVLVHAGMAIEKINEEEAEETLRLIRMITDAPY